MPSHKASSHHTSSLSGFYGYRRPFFACTVSPSQGDLGEGEAEGGSPVACQNLKVSRRWSRLHVAVGNWAKFIWLYCVFCAVSWCATLRFDENKEFSRPLKMKVFLNFEAQRKAKDDKYSFFVTNNPGFYVTMGILKRMVVMCRYFIWVLSPLFGPYLLSEFTLGCIARFQHPFI